MASIMPRRSMAPLLAYWPLVSDVIPMTMGSTSGAGAGGSGAGAGGSAGADSGAGAGGSAGAGAGSGAAGGSGAAAPSSPSPHAAATRATASSGASSFDKRPILMWWIPPLIRFIVSLDPITGPVRLGRSRVVRYTARAYRVELPCCLFVPVIRINTIFSPLTAVKPAQPPAGEIARPRSRNRERPRRRGHAVPAGRPAASGLQRGAPDAPLAVWVPETRPWLLTCRDVGRC